MNHERSRRDFVADLLTRLVSGCAFVAGLAGLSSLASGCGDDAAKYGPLFTDRPAMKYGPLFDARGPEIAVKYGVPALDAKPEIAVKYGVPALDAKSEAAAKSDHK